MVHRFTTFISSQLLRTNVVHHKETIKTWYKRKRSTNPCIHRPHMYQFRTFSTAEVKRKDPKRTCTTLLTRTPQAIWARTSRRTSWYRSTWARWIIPTHSSNRTQINRWAMQQPHMPADLQETLHLASNRLVSVVFLVPNVPITTYSQARPNNFQV